MSPVELFAELRFAARAGCFGSRMDVSPRRGVTDYKRIRRRLIKARRARF